MTLPVYGALAAIQKDPRAFPLLPEPAAFHPVRDASRVRIFA